MNFMVFYDYHITYAGDPDAAPALGVLCIVDCHDIPHIHERSDYYVWKFREEGWTGVDIFGLFDYLQLPGWKKVLFGRTVSNEVYEKVKVEAYKLLAKAREVAR